MAVAKKPAAKSEANGTASAAAVKFATKLFAFDKETPGTFKYTECDESGTAIPSKEALIGGLYLRKDQMKGKTPKVVRIHVEF